MRCRSTRRSRCGVLAWSARLASAALVLVIPTSYASSQTVERQGPTRSTVARGTKEPARRTARFDSVISVNSIPTMVVSTNGRIHEYVEPQGQGSIAGEGVCGQVTHSDPSIFEGGMYNIQLGFAENELAIASYNVDAADYPITVEAMECVFAQNTTVQTETHWQLVVWDGPPQPDYVHSIYYSDDIILPHLVMPTGLRGTNIKVVVDPEDPTQIILQNDSGLNMFSIGFGVFRHNDAPQNPCSAAPEPSTNAFPTTDVDGVATLTGNWLSALICGTLCDDVNRFIDLFEFFCRPTGDWVIRATYSCSLNGACCDVDATCNDAADRSACEAAGGTFMGGDMLCADVTCPTPVGACCVTGVCLDDLEQATCESLTNGMYMGNGTLCDEMLCASGACCMQDGSCQDLMEIECDTVGGTYEGGGTECLSVECPQPRGSCCIDGYCVPNQARDTCELLGTWNGLGSTCEPDPCGVSCPELAIVNVIPAEGTVDARQPHGPSGTMPRQGIGSSVDPIVITLGVAGAEACFTLCETAPDPAFGANDIDTVTDLGGGVYEIVLMHPITPGEATTIRYEGTGEFVDYYSHPGNVNGDSTAQASDIDALLAVLDGAPPRFGLYSVDIDHSGTVTGADVLRLIDLLNGADLLDPWDGTPIPPNSSCP